MLTLENPLLLGSEAYLFPQGTWHLPPLSLRAFLPARTTSQGNNRFLPPLLKFCSWFMDSFKSHLFRAAPHPSSRKNLTLLRFSGVFVHRTHLTLARAILALSLDIRVHASLSLLGCKLLKGKKSVLKILFPSLALTPGFVRLLGIPWTHRM